MVSRLVVLSALAAFASPILHAATLTSQRPPSADEVLSGYERSPLEFQKRFAAWCEDANHADDDDCMTYGDVATWAGHYANTPVEVVPPVALPGSGSGFTISSAITAIPEWTERQRVVIFNEVHDHPETRLLPLELLPVLRKQGFDTLALEALSVGDGALGSRGYPVYKSGYYTREPIMGRLVREALRLGFKVTGYDVTSDRQLDVASREEAQAENLANRVRDGGGHRVVVLAGLAHAYKRKGGYLQGQEPMAARLGQKLGFTPFVIDQVYAFDGATGRTMPGNGLFVLQKNGKPWAAEPAQFDVSIIGHVQRSGPARDGWATLAPSERLVHITAAPCGSDPCLVQAYRKGDVATAVPLDASMTQGKKDITLLLPSGGIEVRYIGTRGKAIKVVPLSR